MGCVASWPQPPAHVCGQTSISASLVRVRRPVRGREGSPVRGSGSESSLCTAASKFWDSVCVCVRACVCMFVCVCVAHSMGARAPTQRGRSAITCGRATRPSTIVAHDARSASRCAPHGMAGGRPIRRSHAHAPIESGHSIWSVGRPLDSPRPSLGPSIKSGTTAAAAATATAAMSATSCASTHARTAQAYHAPQVRRARELRSGTR